MDSDIKEAVESAKSEIGPTEIKIDPTIVDQAKKNKADQEKLPRCPICSGHVGHSVQLLVLPSAMHMLECKCGLYSKVFNTKQELVHWWKTRAGKEPAKVYMDVKHPAAGSTVNKGKKLPGAADVAAMTGQIDDESPF